MKQPAFKTFPASATVTEGQAAKFSIVLEKSAVKGKSGKAESLPEIFYKAGFNKTRRAGLSGNGGFLNAWSSIELRETGRENVLNETSRAFVRASALH